VKGGGGARFTDRARRVVVLAQEAARNLGHDWVGTEHVLLGLIQEGNGVAVKVLESLGIGLEGVQQRVEDIEKTPSYAPADRQRRASFNAVSVAAVMPPGPSR
jgi:ATP-dependent Clp protease ATP-binding subunit ClpC